MFSGTAWNMHVSTKQANLKQISSKKSVNNFCGFSIPQGDPSIFLCFGISMEFFCTFFQIYIFLCRLIVQKNIFMLCLKTAFLSRILESQNNLRRVSWEYQYIQSQSNFDLEKLIFYNFQFVFRKGLGVCPQR